MTSVATEYVRSDDGTRFIPATQRPDGSWRKPRKVKDGYVPQEEVPLYESKGKIFQMNKPQYPVGMNPVDIITNSKGKKSAENVARPGNNPIPGLVIDAQDKASKKKKKKKKSGSQVEEVSDSLARTTINAEALLSSNPHRDVPESVSLDLEWKTATSKGKNKRGQLPVEVPAKARLPTASASVPVNRPPQRVVPPQIQAAVKTEPQQDPSKRLKSLRKKLREIEAVEQKAASGAKLDKDQIEKISRKQDILREIEDLE